MNRFVLVLSVTAILLFSTAWMQTTDTGTVNGTVSLNGAPLPNAVVVLSSSGNSGYTAKATTDASGNFTVSDAPVGSIEAKAYDPQGVFLASGTGVLTKAGDVISLPLSATR